MCKFMRWAFVAAAVSATIYFLPDLGRYMHIRRM
jgi:hypothetical protein